MANEVLIAHTGQRLHVDFSKLLSLDDFRSFVSRQTSIPAECIIALTPQGKPLRLAAFQTEKELYVYDARTTQADAAGSAATANLEIPLPKRYVTSNPPNDLRDQRSLAAWQELFHARQKWAGAVADDCSIKAAAAQERYSEMDAMMRCLDAAVANLEAVVKSTDTKYNDIKKWSNSAQSDYSQLVDQWGQYLELARNISISPAILRFMTGIEGAKNGSAAKGKSAKHQQPTLEDLLDLETARKAGKLAPGALRRFASRITELDRSAPQLFHGCEEVMQGFERAVDRSALSHEGESTQLLQDIKAVASKINTDYQTTLSYSDSTRDVLQASKIAATHTERLLPSIKNRAVEMDEMMRYATQARNVLALETVDFMRTITDLTTLSSEIKAQIAAISNNEEDMAHFDYLRLVQQIPYVYASFVSEAIKRREWLDKVKADSSTLANEMALFHEEEVKRRKKWQKSVGNLAYGPPSSTSDEHRVAGLEVNLLGEEAEWPAVTRKELVDLYDVLQRQSVDTNLINDIGKMISDLNAPTKQQSKRIKAFKNGSVHEAALGRSGLMIRGDDDVLRNLQDDKAKVENKLKTAESRVRRLEDLLHRQSQASRASLGGVFQSIPSGHDSTASVKPGTPRPQHDRRISLEAGAGSGLASAAASSTAADHMRLAQRLQQLETELAAEKERSSSFERDLQTRTAEKTAILGRMDETNSIKKDLLENLEALKNEFTGERKSLEDEIRRLQARLEDTEDEMEHFGESRENEKATYDERMRSLQDEVEHLTKEYRDESLKTQGQVEFLRKETKLQREHNETLEKQLQASQDEAQAATKRVQESKDTEEMLIRGFRDLFRQLVADEAAGDDKAKPKSKSKRSPSPPSDLSDLVETVQNKLADALSRMQTTASDMAIVKADLERAESANHGLREELAASKDTMASEEQAARHLREKLTEEKARITTLEAELAESRAGLNSLRGKISDGETGSESLRKRLEEEEKKVVSLTDEVSAKQSHLGSIEEELRLFREKYQAAQATLSALSTWFDARTLRCKDLSQRLYTQNDRLVRLLERLGYSVTRDGESSMVIQKIPRSERSTIMSGEGGASLLMRKSFAMPPPATPAAPAILGAAPAPAPGVSPTPASPAGASNAKSADVELLYWMNSADGEAEAAKYNEYMAALGSFDIDAVSETVYRRVKEVEHIARKLQRDVRSYREKAHALQKDAHDKIAFRHFKEGDLALFLPTRNQTSGAWAAFNIGFPHYFLREQEAHRLQNREWLVARISRVQEKVVDLSKSLQQQPLNTADNNSTTATINSDNPFDLSDGLRWYLIDAQEDKPGAPSTPGLGKSTVAANNVEAVADIHTHARTPSASSTVARGLGLINNSGVSKTLSRSLESRRSSTSSTTRKAAMAPLSGTSHAVGHLRGSSTAPTTSEASSLRAVTAAPDKDAASSTATPEPAAQASASASTPANHPETTSELHPFGLYRDHSALSETPSKKSIVWDSLWAVDYAGESSKAAE